ncbi:hypothetical protein C8J30_1144 [Rhodobacter viridis]|uniref:Uncharacterized protein n=1 Tax=Rhodobacter viridis TaxID=1054202 RepID=A0A318U7Y7_9RHOB|nr:hypothetical protein [Rhodobacter viridis]PYF08069.1 hypothetical protein C8J30_1144 [Rhodobacter viridis]
MDWSELQSTISEIFKRRYPPKLTEEGEQSSEDPIAIFSGEPTNDRNDVAYERWAIHKLLSEHSERVFLLDRNGVKYAPLHQLFISHALPNERGEVSLYCGDFPEDAKKQYDIMFDVFPLPFVNIEGGCIDTKTNKTQIRSLGLQEFASDADAHGLDGCKIHFRVEIPDGLEDCLYPSPPKPLKPLQNRTTNEHNDKMIQHIITLTHAGLSKAQIKVRLQEIYCVKVSDIFYRSLRIAAAAKDPLVAKPGRKP